MSLGNKNAYHYHLDNCHEISDNDSHRIIFKFLTGSKKILDVGCATGVFGRSLPKNEVEIVGIELDESSAHIAEPFYNRVIVGDVSSANILSQVPDEYFDTIICGDILEHVYNPWQLVTDLSVKLETSGKLLISIPNLGHATVLASLLGGSLDYREFGLLDRTHIRFFGLKNLLELAVGNGLTPRDVKRVRYNLFQTEIKVNISRVPEKLISVLDMFPETYTYQYVLCCSKDEPQETLSDYIERFSLPVNNKSNNFEILSSFKNELVVMYGRLQAEQKNRSSQAYVLDKLSSLYYREIVANKLKLLCDDHEPATYEEIYASCTRTYDIIVPVYNAYDHTAHCLESLVAHTDPKHTVFLLDDCSSDTRILGLLHAFADRHCNIHVMESTRNMGFIANVNRGFGLSSHDVVILNTDTQVTKGWLERLDRCLVLFPGTGAVSPLSNNATILSLPVMNQNNSLPVGYDVDSFAALVARNSTHQYPQIPTAVGFCMLITRKALEQCGEFNLAFGSGYGEECDFCMRVWSAGMEVRCCDDAYVHHYGAASFGDSTEMNTRRLQNQQLLSQMWPDYMRKVVEYCLNNPLRELQERINSSLTGNDHDKNPQVLHVIHMFLTSGGTDSHTLNMICGEARRYRSTVLYPHRFPEMIDINAQQANEILRLAMLSVHCIKSDEFFSGFPHALWNDVIERKFLQFVRGGDYEIVHFQHLLFWTSFLLPFIAKALGKKVIISLHDYFFLCPEYNMMFPDKVKCDKRRALPEDPVCINCLSERRSNAAKAQAVSLNEYLAERNAIIELMLNQVDKIVAPSQFVKSRFQEAFGDEIGQKIKVIPHGVTVYGVSPRPQREGVLRVGFVGSFNSEKGAMIFMEAAVKLADAPVQFHVFGGVIDAELSETARRSGMILHGAYKVEQLPSLLTAIDIAVVGSVWHETFCLVLTELQAMGVPVIASSVGAISERIQEGVTGFLYPAGDTGRLAERLLAIALDESALVPVINGLRSLRIKTVEENAADYVQLYDDLLQH